MLPRFEEVCDSVMKLSFHKKTVIRYTVAELIPRLARRCPSAFGRRYLDVCLKFLIKNADDTKSRGANEMRPTCFIAIGQLCLALQINNHPPHRYPTPKKGGKEQGTPTGVKGFSSRAGLYDYLDEIFNLVKEGLKSKSSSSRSKPCSSEALHCAADLVEALGPQAEPYIPRLIDEMFNAGLSQQLIYALHSISVCSPRHQAQIEERLLEELSLCLAGNSNAYAVVEKNAIDPTGTKKQHAQQNYVRTEAANLDSSNHQRRSVNRQVRLNARSMHNLHNLCHDKLTPPTCRFTHCSPTPPPAPLLPQCTLPPTLKPQPGTACTLLPRLPSQSAAAT